jgi:polyisoprenoid-binding protein YceI
MTVAKGIQDIGPSNGKVIVNIYKDGIAKGMGHDLAIGASSWSGKADINPDDPSSSSVEATIDIGSLDDIEAVGGGSLSPKDKGDIKKNMEKVLGRGDITFESTAATANSVKGNLTIKGQSRPVTLNLTVNDSGHVTATTSIRHSDFGLKPFSAPLGVLKVKDGVDISIELDLPTA